MSTTNVEFYQKMKDLQDKQHDNEKKRVDLEQQLNVYIKSDHRLARLKAIRLQNYWKKICEDEKRSQWRNEQLLRDFDRVESHMATLSARTDRLRTMKKQYEEYIEKTYPNWKEKILHHQRLKHHVERQQQLETQVQAQAAYSYTAGNAGLQAGPVGYSLSNTSGATFTPNAVISSPNVVGLAQASNAFPGSTPSAQADVVAGPPPTAILTAGYLNLPDQPTAYRISSTLPAPTTHRLENQNVNASFVADQNYPDQRGVTAADVIVVSSQLPGGSSVQTIPQQVPAATVSPDADDEKCSVEEENIAPVSSPHRPPSGYQPPDDGHQVSAQHQPKKATRLRTDDTDDFDSDMSLPMSGDESAPKVQATRPDSAPFPKPDSVYLRPDITREGLYNLLATIEGELPTSIHVANIYQTDMPGDSVKKEIMQNANKGSMLSHMNCPSISMVVIDQLPLLVSNSEEGCLLPDSVLYKPSSLATHASVRGSIHPTSQSFWDRLYEHFLHILKYNVLDAEGVANIFAPLLISDESPYVTGATALLTTVLESADVDVIKTPVSTSTFSTLSPRKRPEETDVKQSYEIPHTIPETNLKQDIKPESCGSDDGDDDFFSEPMPKAQPVVPLTQTAAYRQLLGGTMSSTQNDVSYVDSEEDDVEAQLGSAISGKQDKKQADKQPVLEIAGSPIKEETGPLSPQGGSRVSSPSLGSTGTGYVPSALDTDHKSGTGSYASTGKSAKKGPAFYGDSDTDEDISIPGMNASEQKSVSKPQAMEDDFDFYG